MLPAAGLLPAAFPPPASLPSWTWLVVFLLIPVATVIAADRAFPDEV